MAATAVAVLGVCDRVINFVNFHLLSDLAVAADLAMATARCAVYNVRVNLSDIADPHERQTIESTIGQTLSHAAVLIQRVSPRIWARPPSARAPRRWASTRASVALVQRL